MATRITPDREREIIEAYRAWDPAVQPINAFLREQGLVRQTLYNVLERNGIPTKTETRIRAERSRSSEEIDLRCLEDLQALLRAVEYHLEGVATEELLRREAARVRDRWPLKA
jgi:hypothetical protein